MDGNEKDLPARREGIGDSMSIEEAGVGRKTPRGENKRALKSLVTPIERDSGQFDHMENDEQGVASKQKKKKDDKKKLKNSKTSLSTMMHTDVESDEEATDEEELEAYLAQWRDDDLSSDNYDSEIMTDNEKNEDANMENNELDDQELEENMDDNGLETSNNGQDGHELDTNGDFGKANDFTKASSLARMRNSITDTTINGTSWIDRKNKRERKNTDTDKVIRFMDVEGMNRNQNQIKTVKAKNLGVASGRTAVDKKMETDILKVGPGMVASPEVVAPTQKMFTYNMQVSFQNPLGENGAIMKKGNYNVPTCFKQLVQQLHILSPAITVLPYNTNGVPVTNVDQLPDNEIEDYIIYYHNHQVTAGGQLTGMCSIESPFAWYQLKDEKKTLFKWLRDKRVFLKYVSFKADIVSAAGWFYGMNPDVIRKDEAKEELIKRLGQNLPSDLSFQIVPRMLSITDKITRNRLSFKGVAIECDRSRVRDLQEALYSMDSPAKARYEYGITGGTLFVPFVENDVWKNEKILGMAKMHVQEMNKLGQIFLQNVRNIDEILQWKDGEEESLRTMLTNCTTSDGHRMVHSVHNSNREGTITILYYKEYTTEVNNTFPDIQDILERQLVEESRGRLANEGSRIVMTGRQNFAVGSTASKAYASYADIILEGMNPQGGDEDEEVASPPRKRPTQRRSPPRMTYSQIAKPKRTREEVPKKGTTNRGNPKSDVATETSDSEFSIEEEPPKVSEAITGRLQQRLEELQKQFEENFGKKEGIDMETTKKLIEENNKKIQKQSEEFFEQKLKELSVNLTKEIQRSNDFIFDKFAALNAQQNATLISL